MPSLVKHPLIGGGGLIPLIVSLFHLVSTALQRLFHQAAAVGRTTGCIRLESRCTVCLEDVFCYEKFRVLPECGHGFHTECVDKWLTSRRNCPLCRTPVEGDRRSLFERLLVAVIKIFCKWMDSKFDSELTLVFCQDS